MNRLVRPIVSAVELAMFFSLLTGAPALADLAAYVKRADGAFAWTADGQRSTPAGKVHDLLVTSQVWQGAPWKHHLQIFEPSNRPPGETVLLFITGGDNTKAPGPGDAATGFGLAQACGATCAVLHQVPNQPLLGNKREDALIAETFVRYLETGDETWPLLFPMAKSAVRAMDAVQEWARQNGKPAVTRFVISGASKRGWTTWLTAASVDPRVAAIAPMVIDTLNMKAQKNHALEVWGRQSEQIDDYTSRGLTDLYDTDSGRRLWLMVDPHAYRDRLLLPKLLINGTNDAYWTLDALNIYWDDLKGPKAVVYLPNAGHGLQANRDFAVNGVGALFRHVVSDRPLPTLAWSHRDHGAKLRLEITSSPAPKSARLWVATAPTRDFRKAQWNSTQLPLGEATIVGDVARPETGYIALLGDLEYEIDTIRYHLSTQVRQAGSGTEK
jgi:PhoPQ-activated pathogenicity-related protein